VVQIYVSKDNRAESDPIASLRDFRRVHIKAGKSVTVDFELPRSAFETINNEGAAEYLPGSYTVIAADAAPIPGVPVPVAQEKGAPAFVSAKIIIY
jgi:beta-glucosidase